MTEAKRRDVPILLSVGYASCHLCFYKFTGASDWHLKHEFADISNWWPIDGTFFQDVGRSASGCLPSSR
jgi:hypothetical protein